MVVRFKDLNNEPSPSSGGVVRFKDLQGQDLATQHQEYANAMKSSRQMEIEPYSSGRLGGAQVMDDVSVTPDPTWQDKVASVANKAANLPVIKPALEKIGQAYEAVENVPIIDKTGGALSGLFKTAPDLFDPNIKNPYDAWRNIAQATKEGFQNPDEAKESFKTDFVAPITKDMGKVNKFLFENTAGGIVDPITYALPPAIGATAKGVKAGVGGLKRYADLAATDVLDNAMFNASRLETDTGRTVQSPSVIKRAKQVEAETLFEQFDNSMQQKYNPNNADVDITQMMKPKERKTYTQLQNDSLRFSTKSDDVSIAPSKETPVQANVEPEKVPMERSNFANQRNNGNFSDDFYNEQGKRDLTYEPITNKDTVDRVNERFEKENIDDIRASFQGATEFDADHTLTGYRLMQKLDQAGKYEDAVNVAEKLAADLTKSGQTIQAASVLSRLSPEGQLLQLTRTAKRNGKTVKPEDAQLFMEQAKVRQEGVSSGPQTAKFYDLLDRMKKGETVSTAELQSSVEKMLGEAHKAVKPAKPVNPTTQRKRDKVVSYLAQEAEAAMKELASKQNLGFAKKVGTPDIVLYSKIAAHQLAQKMVNVADFTEMLVKQAGEQVRPHAKEIYDRANKLIGRADKHISPDKVAILEKFLKDGKYRPEDETALRGIASHIDQLKGKKALEADMKMQEILNSYEKSSLGAKIATIRYMSMLFNTSTQLVNTISGPMMMIWRQILDGIGTVIDVPMAKLTKKDRSTTVFQGPGAFDHLFTPLIDWFKSYGTGAKAGWKGVDPEGITSQHDVRGLTFKSKLNPLGLIERSLGAVSKGADFATYNATKNMELRKIAYLDALNKGVKGKKDIRTHMDKFLAEPSQKGVEQASRIGKKTTFQNTEGLAGGLSRAARNVDRVIGEKTHVGSENLGPVQAVVPFIKTPTNIAITGVENTPVGVLKGLLEINRLRKGADDITKREILSTFVSATAGGSLVLGGLGYILSDLGIINGDYEYSDRDVQSLEDQIGEGKFRFNTTALGRMVDALLNGEDVKKAAEYQKGDKQFDYNKLQPLAFPVAAGANLAKNKDKPMLDRAKSAADSSLSSLFGMSALQGFQNTFRTSPDASDAEKVKQVFQNVGENMVKSFSPSLMAQEARRQDPTQRKVSYNKSFKEDIVTYFKSRTPFGVSEKLPARITNLGDEKENPKGIIGTYLNPLRSEEAKYNEAAKIIHNVIKKTGDDKLAPPTMEQTIKGTKKGEKEQSSVKLSDERWTEYQQDVGKEISKRVTELSPIKRDAKNIEKIYTDVKDLYRNKIKKELGFRVQ